MSDNMYGSNSTNAEIRRPASGPAKRSVGIVTASSAGGATVGGALAQIIVWWAEQGGLDMTRIEVAISVVLTAAFGVLGGWLVPSPTKGRYEA